MIVRNLKHTHPADVVNCLIVAFENYYVKVPTDHEYWINRWKMARVNYELSAGIFDENKLVGFVLHGIDTDSDGVLTAFNCCTGILPEYRKKGFVQELYQYLFPALKQNGIQKCGLEVITQNDIALQSYERAGFEIAKRYKCFMGQLHPTGALVEHLRFSKIHRPNWNSYEGMQRCNFSWEHTDKALKAANEGAFDCWELYDDTALAGYTVLKANGHILQFGVVSEAYLHALLDAIAGITTQVRIINMEDTATHLYNLFIERGLMNSIDQYYMECKVS